MAGPLISGLATGAGFALGMVVANKVIRKKPENKPNPGRRKPKKKGGRR